MQQAQTQIEKLELKIQSLDVIILESKIYNERNEMANNDVTS